LDSIKIFLKDFEEYEVIVVDNASDDKSADMVKKFFPWVRLVENDANIGFGSACNMGSDKSTGDILAFINPDVRFQSATSVTEVLSFFAEQPNVAIVGPKLLFDNGVIQPSVRRFPTPLTMVLMLLKLGRLSGRLTAWKRYNYSNFNYQAMRSVDQVMGAALFIRREIFIEVGRFDQNFFVWFEEVDLCKRVKEAGYLVFFLPDMIMYHSKSRAFAQQSILARQINFSNSARYYAWKHFSIITRLIVGLVSWLAFLPTFALLPFAGKLKKYQATEK
jgi:GT2 family glycosyltransferase